LESIYIRIHPYTIVYPSLSLVIELCAGHSGYAGINARKYHKIIPNVKQLHDCACRPRSLSRMTSCAIKLQGITALSGIHALVTKQKHMFQIVSSKFKSTWSSQFHVHVVTCRSPVAYTVSPPPTCCRSCSTCHWPRQPCAFSGASGAHAGTM